MSNLEIKALSKTYQRPRTRALKRFSAQFTSGVYGILGANGSGKSTLFKAITNAISYKRGQILYEGKDVSLNWQAFKKNIGYMPQQQEIYPNMSVEKFLAYMAVLKDVDSIDQEVSRVMALTSIDNLAKQRLSSLSGGMKQRVLISQALISKPAILILDEPTAGLDPLERVRIRNFIASIALNKIVLIATHLVSDIECIAKEIIILKQGSIISQKTAAATLADYQGKVFSGLVPREAVSMVIDSFQVTSLREQASGEVFVKICGDFDKAPLVAGRRFTPAEPNLEDAYLYLFGHD